MATTYRQVDADHEAFGRVLDGARSLQQQARDRLLSARDQLVAATTDYAETITTVNGYTPTGAVESLQKDRQSKLAAERGALITAIEADLTALGVSFA